MIIGRREEEGDGSGKAQVLKGVQLEGEERPVGERYRDLDESGRERVDDDILDLDTDVGDGAKGAQTGDGEDER